MSLPPCLRATPEGTQLALKVQPRASRSDLAGVHGAELRVRLTAPPVDDAANRALVEFFAERLDCARPQVRLIRGATSRHKLVQILGLEPAEVARRLGL